MNVLELDERTITDALEAMRSDDASECVIRGVHNQRGRVEVSLWAREIYSYDRHFPLVHYVPREVSGQRRDLYVLNGDSWRGPLSRTNDHQEATRRYVEQRDADSIVIPFSALGGARIVIDSIRPIHVREDARWTTREEIPGGPIDFDDLESADSSTTQDVFDYSSHPVRRIENGRTEYTWRRHGRRYNRTYYGNDSATKLSVVIWRDGRIQCSKDENGAWTEVHNHHRLGDAYFSAIIESTVEDWPLAGETGMDENRSEHCPEDASGHVADVDRKTCAACGAGLRKVPTIVSRRARFLSSFDYNEPMPLYFLCEVPRGAGETVEQAIDALAPRAVHAAMARGREVLRQGDVFFIATDLHEAALTGATRTRARLTQWTRGAKAKRGEVCYVPALTAADRRKMHAHARKLWRERFRHEVQRATHRGRDLSALKDSRQRAGACIARGIWIHAKIDARARFDAAARNSEKNRERVRDALAIYGTAHSATEVIRLKSGAVYARGIARHVPDLERGRAGERDHVHLPLGDGSTWYLAVRNRVPRQTRRRRTNSAQQRAER